jgi:uncharacterized lipoprotein YajG
MRHTLSWMSLAAASVLLSACSSFMPTGSSTSDAPAASQKPARPVQQCQQAGAQWAVGKTNTEHTINEARQRAGAYMARVLRPGQPTTREFNAERLNLTVDVTGRITAAHCG